MFCIVITETTNKNLGLYIRFVFIIGQTMKVCVLHMATIIEELSSSTSKLLQKFW